MKNFFMSIVLLLTLFSCILTQNTNENNLQNPNPQNLATNGTKVDCPAISYFAGYNTNGLGKVVPNFTGFCPNLDDTCCGYDDFKLIQNWWQEPQVEISVNSSSMMAARVDLRKQSQQNVFLFTKELLKLKDDIYETAQRISSMETSDDYCSSSAKRVLRHDFEQSLIFNYQKEAEVCWEFIDELQVSLMCSACDPKAQKYLNFADKQIHVDEDTLSKFTLSCSSMIKLNVQKLYPYLRLIEHLARCDRFGKISSKEQIHFPHDQIVTSKIFGANIPKKEVANLLSFGTKLNINSEGNEEYLVKLLANTMDMISHDVSYLNEEISLDTLLRKMKPIVQKLTSREIQEKLENFVKSLKTEGKDMETLELLLEKEKQELKPLLKNKENFDFDAYRIDSLNNRNLAGGKGFSEMEPDSPEFERFLAESKDTTKDKLEERIKGIQTDIEKKFEKYEFKKFERSYPPTKKMIKEGSKNYKQTFAFTGDKAWRGDWHKALIHYITCNDYDLFTPDDMRDGKKMKKKDKQAKEKCDDKITLDKSVTKFIKTIPYGPYRYNNLVAPDESDDDQSDENKTKNEKKWDCWKDNVVEKFDKLMEGLDDDGKFEEKEQDEEDNSRRLLEVRQSEEELESIKKNALSPHPKDRELWIKIKRMAKTPSRQLASRHSTSEEELSLPELLQQAHDRHRILSLMRYHENNKQKKRVTKLNKKLKKDDKEERRLEEAKKDGNEKGDTDTQAVEEGEDADDSIRVLDQKPQAMGEADVDETEEKPEAPADKRGLTDRENEQIKAVDTAMAQEKKPDAKIVKNNITKPLKRRLDDNEKENEEQDVKNMDKKQDDNDKKEEKKKSRALEDSGKQEEEDNVAAMDKKEDKKQKKEESKRRALEEKKEEEADKKEDDKKEDDKKEDDKKEDDKKEDDKKEDATTEKKADAAERRLAEESYILNYNLSSRNRILQQAEEPKNVVTATQPEN